jgi:hypothetical protein
MGGSGKPAALLLLVVAVAALTVFNVIDVTRDAPKFSELVAHDALLQAPVEISSTGRRTLRGRYAVFRVDGERDTVEELCDVWDCRLPAAVDALRSGDHLTIWTAGSRIWQLNHDGELLLDYQQAVDAHRRASVRKEGVGAFLVVAMLVALALVFVRRQRRQAPALSTRVPAPASAPPARIKWSIKAGKHVNVATHVHTQALNGPALERFQDAAKRRDRDAMIAALVEAGLSESSAGHAADALLGDPHHLLASPSESRDRIR